MRWVIAIPGALLTDSPALDDWLDSKGYKLRSFVTQGMLYDSEVLIEVST